MSSSRSWMIISSDIAEERLLSVPLCPCLQLGRKQRGASVHRSPGNFKFFEAEAAAVEPAPRTRRSVSQAERKADGAALSGRDDWRAFSAAAAGYESSSLTRLREGSLATPGSTRTAGGSINCREISAMSSWSTEWHSRPTTRPGVMPHWLASRVRTRSAASSISRESCRISENIRAPRRDRNPM